MQCKVFNLPLDPEVFPDRERKLNEFLKAGSVKRIFASIAEVPKGGMWSVMFFYDESASPPPSLYAEQTRAVTPQAPMRTGTVSAPSAASGANAGATSQRPPAEEGPPLSGEQLKGMIALKRWRADQAAQEGVPLYMVAHNKWLEDIVRMPARGVQDILKVRGMGEWRAKKYGPKILEVLGGTPGTGGSGSFSSSPFDQA